MLPVEIREALPADVEQIAAVSASATATLRETYRPNARALAHKKAITDSLKQLVAVVEGAVVGLVEYKFEAGHKLEHGRVHFMSLDVHADFRQRGVATQLVNKLAEIGKQAGTKVLSTYTVTQTGNCAIFEKMGFRVINEEPSELFESDQFDTITETYLERPIG